MAKQERVNNTVNNIFWMWFFVGVTSILPFIVRTIILREWGMDYLGMNNLFTSILGAFNLGELGIGQALVIFMYKPVAEGDIDTVGWLIYIYRKVYFFLAMLLLFVGGVIFPILPHLIKGEVPVGINIYVIYTCFLIQAVASYLVFPYCQAAFMANQISGLTYRNHGFVWLFFYGIQIIFLLVNRNYYAYIIILPIATSLCGIVDRLVFQKKFSQYDYFSRYRTEAPTGFWEKFAKTLSGITLRKITAQVRDSIDSIIITSVMGLVALAKYQNYALLFSVPYMFANSVMSGIVPVLGNAIATEEVESNYQVTKIVEFVNNWLSTVFSAVLVCMYQPFILLWAGEESLLTFSGAILFAAYFYCKQTSEINNLVRNSSGVWWQGKWVSIAETIINLGLNLALVSRWGIEGIVLATVISIVCISLPFDTFYVYKYYFGRKPWRNILLKAIYGIVAFGVSMVTYGVAHIRGDIGWISLILSAVAAFVFANFVMLILFHRSASFKELLNIGRSFFLKK